LRNSGTSVYIFRVISSPLHKNKKAAGISAPQRDFFRLFFTYALFLIWVDDVGEGRNFFSREKKPNVGFVILFPLSRHSLGDGGSLPFKKSGKTFLFTSTYPCQEQSENKRIFQFLR
jgi:hypothetical protein